MPAQTQTGGPLTREHPQSVPGLGCRVGSDMQGFVARGVISLHVTKERLSELQRGTAPQGKLRPVKGWPRGPGKLDIVDGLGYRPVLSCARWCSLKQELSHVCPELG